KPLLELPGFTLEGLNPLAGFVRIRMPDNTKKDILKLLTFIAAGPVCGAVASVCIFKAIKKHFPDYTSAQMVALFAMVINILQILPIAEGCDGDQIRKYLDAYSTAD